jgi:trk system potassium uptake protein TrkH
MFCNAGFTIHNDNLNWFINTQEYFIISSLLMIIGSLGFIFFFEIIQIYLLKNKNTFSLSVKLIFWGYGITTIIAWFFYWYFSENASYTSFGIIRSLFSAISLRNCGIFPYEITQCSHSMLVWTSLYGIFGGCPLGTGGGLKNSIICILFAGLYNMIFQRDYIIFFKKKISSSIVLYSFFIFSLLFIFTLCITNILNTITYNTFDYGLLFSNVLGMITGSGLLWEDIINYSLFVKMILIFTMCCGKIGITFLLLRSGQKKNPSITYPEEKIVLL